MRIIIISVIIALLSFSCKSYVHVFETSTTNAQIEIKDKLYVFENDSLKITYSFWAEYGLMSFSVFNKLDKPLYLDWRKSSYIDNSIKLDYWINEEITKSLDYYGVYYYDGPLLEFGYLGSETVGTSVSNTVKPERLTFIPPSSYYFRNQFYILPNRYIKLDTEINCKEVARNDKPKKKTKIYEQSFLKENSPLIFRNFLTFSYSENFENEYYVDNKFFISKIIEMDRKHFAQCEFNGNIWVYVKDENGKLKPFSQFKKGNSFFINIPKTISVPYRD